ncbi:MAG: glycosyltransferase family A protein, partial [Acidobacteria bacterium]|nr:glycosyltransferase family A protein [Acidobacteriota bacterium]
MSDFIGTQHMPMLSIVVPFLNEERWLALCLDCLRRQTLDRAQYEVIFVDNGSTDRSLEILRAEENVVVVHEERRDPYLARNRGVEEARGSYIVFLDADCLAAPDWLSQLVIAIDTTNAKVILGGIAYPDDASIWLRCYRDYYDQKLEYLLKKKLTAKYFGHAGNMAIERAMLLQLGPFLAMPIVGDTEVLHRMTAQAPEAEICFWPKAVVVHAEVTSFQICMQKVFQSGQYSRSLSTASGSLPLSIEDRVQVYFNSIKTLQYGWWKQLAMLGTLGIGWLA